MSIRGHGPEIALAASSLLFAGGIVADASAEHVGVSERVVHELEGSQDELQSQLDGSYPVLEALYRDEKVTTQQATKLGADENWFALHNKLDEVGADLDEATEGNGVLNLVGKLGWGLGMVSIFGSGVVLNESAGLRYRQRLQEARRIRQDLERDYDLEGKVVGLQRPDIPTIDIDAAALSAFTIEKPENALALLAKRTQRDEVAIGALEMIRGLAAEDAFDQQVIALMQPLFGAKVEKIAGGYDARDFGNRIAKFVEHCVELWALAVRPKGERVAADPERQRLAIPPALNLLDKILPLDQEASDNPLCDDPNLDYYGRHWIDYIGAEARRFNAQREPVQA